MTREEKINEIRKCILKNKYPFDMPINFYNGNCYAYALLSTFIDKDTYDYIYNLGNISQVFYPPKSIEEAKKAFEYDMETLGIDYFLCSYDDSLENDEWKVALFYDSYDKDSYNFHFMVQNSNGNWSHKKYFGGPLRNFGNNNPIYYNTDLTFVGFYILKANKEKIRKRIF